MASGGRAVKALFCEADGVIVRLQREAKRQVEVKLAIIHEGWERLHPCSGEYRLKGKLVYAAVQGSMAFWETLSFLAGRRWDLSAVKVIAGDGAEWVKKGLGYFPGAVYQLCRFHLARKIRQCLGARVRNPPGPLTTETHLGLRENERTRASSQGSRHPG